MFRILSLVLLLSASTSLYAAGCYFELGAARHQGLVDGQDWEDQESLGTHYGIGCRAFFGKDERHELDGGFRHYSHLFVGSPFNDQEESYFDWAGLTYRYYFLLL